MRVGVSPYRVPKGRRPGPWMPANGKCPNQLARRPYAKWWAPQQAERGIPGVALRLPDQAEQVALAGG
jgi:hypothetical protein